MIAGEGDFFKWSKKANLNLKFDNSHTDFRRWMLTIAGAQLDDSGHRTIEYKQICRLALYHGHRI